jgi:hypothetical protein
MKVVGEKEFKVHRVILASRSPVFRAMFAMGDMAESITGRTVVEDVNPDDMVTTMQPFNKQKLSTYLMELEILART